MVEWNLLDNTGIHCMQAKLDAHPLFERISDEELEKDVAAGLLTDATEEGQKVARNSGKVSLLCR